MPRTRLTPGGLVAVLFHPVVLWPMMCSNRNPHRKIVLVRQGPRTHGEPQAMIVQLERVSLRSRRPARTCDGLSVRIDRRSTGARLDLWGC